MSPEEKWNLLYEKLSEMKKVIPIPIPILEDILIIMEDLDKK